MQSSFSKSVAVVLTIIYVLKFSNVIYMNIYWDATSIILETVLAYILLGEVLAYILLGEVLDNKYQFVGLIMIIVGIVLLNQGKIPV